MHALKTICLTLLALLFASGAAASEIKIVSTTAELMATSGPGQPDGLTVLIKDGEYHLPHPIVIDGNQITYKGLNNDKDKVKLLGKGPFGKVTNVFSIKGNRIYIQHLSLGEVSNHGIQIRGEHNADHIFLQHLRFYNIKEQMLKGSFDKKQPDNHTDFGLIENCIFEFPEGFSYQSYTGGIDIHHGENWVVKNNRFSNIRTRNKVLTEGAIHFWNSSKNCLITDNRIENCDRGIMLGFDNSYHHGGIIRNNRIHTVVDTGIYLCNATDVTVSNNTIFIDSSYPNAIEFRFKGSHDNHIHDNHTNRRISSRNGGRAQLYNNQVNRNLNWPLNSQPVPDDPPPANRLQTASDYLKINALHKDGQTFITFPETGFRYPPSLLTYQSFFQFRKNTKTTIRYKIYQDTAPIKAVGKKSPIAILGPYTGINPYFYGRFAYRKHKEKELVRYVIPNVRGPLPLGTGLFVLNPGTRGRSYYAVTSEENGKENTLVILGKNSLQHPILESIGQGKPVLQRIEKPAKFLSQKNPTLYFFTRWETDPNTADSGRPYDYLVAVPQNLKKPAPVGIHMHGWGGNLMEGYAWWQNADAGAILLSSNQDPYDWWTGYVSNYYSRKNGGGLTFRAKTAPMVKPYCRWSC